MNLQGTLPVLPAVENEEPLPITEESEQQVEKNLSWIVLVIKAKVLWVVCLVTFTLSKRKNQLLFRKGQQPKSLLIEKKAHFQLLTVHYFGGKPMSISTHYFLLSGKSICVFQLPRCPLREFSQQQETLLLLRGQL